MEYTIGFGTEPQTVIIPQEYVLDVLYPNKVKVDYVGMAEVQRALNDPIGTSKIENIVRGKKKIAIITSDITRPMPSYVVLPVLLKKIYSVGITPEQITVVFGLGSHRLQTEEEKKKLVGESVFGTVKCIDSIECGFVHMGVTKNGTPVDISRDVAEADCRICLGNIEYHYFAGYSGGAKAIMPGVSTRAAIQANHKRMVELSACAGRLKGNPIREDIEDAERICKVDFIINVVLDSNKQIIKCVCGDVRKAHLEGCKFLDQFYLKDIRKKADIVLVSQGGAPKDLNLYQTQKALDNAKHAVKDGGIVILVGSCKEGFGEKVFEDWMMGASCSHQLIERIQENFELGGHKAAAIGMVLEKAEIFLVSQMDADVVKKIFMTPFYHVQEAYDAAIKKLGKEASVLILPFGGSTLPRVICSNNVNL